MVLICFEYFVKDGMLRACIVEDEAVAGQFMSESESKICLHCESDDKQN